MADEALDGPVKTQHVSLTPAEHEGLRRLAREERGGNISATVGRLIREEVARRWGVAPEPLRSAARE